VIVDFHVHTAYSPDSVITFPRLVEACRRKGVDAVAVMDHDVIEGALEFASLSEEMRSRGEWAPRIIVGEEVRTSKGEVCGMFISERVPDHLPPRETMELIRGQGGLVYLPHPFDLLKLKRLYAHEVVELTGLIDIVEVSNGKPRFPLANVLARRFLEDNDFLRAAGSDAHEPVHIGAARVEMEDFSGPRDLLEKLAGGTVSCRMYSPFASAFIRVKLRRKAARAPRIEDKVV